MTLAIITRRAPGAPKTWNAETQTLTAVLATPDAGVPRQDGRGFFVEFLDLSAARLPERLPLLDAHNRESMDRVIGFVTDIRMEAGALVGTVRLSRHNPRAQQLAADISDGATFGISIGYSVNQWSERVNPETRQRERVAVAWTPIEVSVVPIPADPHAGMRSDMPPEVTASVPANTGSTVPAPITTPPADTTTRAAPPHGSPGPSRADINRTIRELYRAAGLGPECWDPQIDAGATFEQAGSALLDELRSRAIVPARPAAAAGPSFDDPAVRIRAMGEALYARVNPEHKLSEMARAFVGLGILDIARESMRFTGQNVIGLSGPTVIERALQTTSDFPLILGDTVGRTVRAAYAAVPSSIMPLARRTGASDFRERRMVALSGDVALLKVNEHGEFKNGSLSESGESYRVDTYGRIVGFTRQVLVNDDLGVFNDVPRVLGKAAADFVSKQLALLVLSNPVMADGHPVFSAQHGNLSGTGSALNLASLSAARLAMRRQTDESGEIVGVTPRYLVVSPDLETAAEQAVAEIAAADPTNVNPFSKLMVVVEPRFVSSRWYLAGDPNVTPGIEYAYLDGDEQPQIITQAGFDIDGVRMRVRLDFGAGWVDWRSWFSNPGPT